jgi:ABC-2 type transport system ATP-binding protein
MKITLENICHSYSKNKLALNNISLELNNGITGLLGVNGAGKSSLLNILATSITPSSGKYLFNEIDCISNPFEIRKTLGYLPQNVGFLEELTVYKSIEYIGLLKGCSPSYLKENIQNVLDLLNLSEQKEVHIKELSGGMKQRVGIAQAIINKPKILILDEPIIGLDPNERYNFNALISEFSKDAIILISSHIIEDIENISENVILLEKGTIKYNGNTAALIASMNNLVFEKTISRDEFNQIKDKTNILRTKPMGDNLVIRFISNSEKDAQKVLPTLEDAFTFKTKIAP